MAFTATLNMSSDTQGIYCGIVVVSKNVAILTRIYNQEYQFP